MKNILYKTIFILSFFSVIGATTLLGQQFKFETGCVSLVIPTPAGDLSASDSSMTCSFNSKTGTISLSVAINAFLFNTSFVADSRNKAATDRFLVYYMEAEQYPYATFEGVVQNKGNVNFSKDGTYSAKVNGKGTVHGVTQQVTLDFAFIVKGNSLTLQTIETVNSADFKIRKPPSIVNLLFDKVKVSMSCRLKKS